MDSANIDTFTLKRYKREAISNLHADPYAGHIALSMIALLEWDQEGMETSHRAALGIRNDSFTHAHYANLLMLIGRFQEALDELRIAINMEPGNLTYLRKGIASAESAGNFREAIKLHTLLIERDPGKNTNIKETTMSLSTMLEANGISEDVVVKSNAIAFEILRRKRLRFLRTRIHADIQDNYAMLYIDLDADEDVIEKIDEELGIELFDKVPEFNPDKYWVGYVKGRVAE